MKFIKNTYIGSYSFYKKTSKVAIPLALQQMLSSAMGICLLDPSPTPRD